MKLRFTSLLALLVVPTLLCAAEKNRFNLSDKPEKPRFKVTDKTWPQKIGEADICLWHDDKLAALSFGVDDNQPGDIDWWKEQASKYDFKLTWFLITGRIDYSRSVGFWKQYRELSEMGHGIESHSVTHLHMTDPNWGGKAWSYAATAEAKKADPDAPKPGEPMKRTDPSTLTLKPEEIAKGVEWEYVESKAQLEKNFPGKQAGALAYPGGGFTKYNDRQLAAKVYRTVRGTHGSANSANAVDYMATNAQSTWDFGGEGHHPVGNVNNILEPNLYRGMFYRGWAVLFCHNIVDAMKPRMQETFEWKQTNSDKLWVGLFADVGKYGQERDTATLKVESPGPDKITFSLTDEMDDSYFNFPLTVKVRVPNEWQNVAATQGSKSIAAKIIQHEGAAYALVDAVPDAGSVTITKK